MLKMSQKDNTYMLKKCPKKIIQTVIPGDNAHFIAKYVHTQNLNPAHTILRI